jgi:hypothetical protein
VAKVIENFPYPTVRLDTGIVGSHERDELLARIGVTKIPLGIQRAHDW